MAATLVKTLSMQIVADPGNAREVLADLKADGEELSKPISLVATADTAEAQGAVDDLADATSRAAMAQERFTETQKAQADAAARVAELQGDGTASADDLTAATDRLTDASLAAADARKNLARMTAVSSDEQVAAGIKTEESAGESGLSFGKFGLVAGLALAGVAYESSKMAVGFQSDMEMIHTQAGVAQSAIPGLESGVLSLSGKVGFSPDSLAGALYHVESSFASVGIKGPQALSLLTIAAKGATVGHADLTDVTNALDAAVVSGIPGVRNYGQAMGALNAVVGAGDMTMQDLADAAGTGIFAIAKTYGQTLPQVGAALALFGDNNIRGAKAATELRMAWQAVQAPLATAGPVLKSIGLDSTSLAQTLERHGMTAAVAEFVQHLKASKVPADQWGQDMTEIFGKKAGVGIGVMVDQLDRYKGKLKAVADGSKDFGKDVAAAYATPAEKLKQLESGGEAAATSLGLVLLPALESVLGPAVRFLNWVDGSKTKMEVFAGVVGALAGTVLVAKLGGAVKGGVKDFQELSGMVQTAATKLGILTGAQEAQTGATEEAAGAQAELDGAMDANPIGLIILGVVALIAVIILVVTHLKDFKRWGVDAFHFVMEGADDALKFIKRDWPLLLGILLGPIALAAGIIYMHWRGIKTGATDAVHWVEHAFDWLTGRLETLLLQGGINLVMGLVHGIESVAMDPVHAVEGIVGDVRSLLPFSPAKKGPLSGSGSPDLAGKKLMTMLADGITSGASQAERAALGAVGGVSSALSGGGGGRGGPGGGGDVYNFYVSPLSDQTKVARDIQQMLLALKRRNGRAPLGLG